MTDNDRDRLLIMFISAALTIFILHFVFRELAP